MNPIQTFFQKRHNLLTPFSIFCRLACAYFICLSYTVISSQEALTDFSFFRNIPFPLLILGILIVFLLLNVIRSNFLVSILTVISGTIYAYLALKLHRQPEFLFCIIAAAAFLIFYTNILQYKFSLPDWGLYATLIGLFSVVTMAVGFVCVLHYNNNNTSCFDFGIFSQMFYNMKTTGLPVTTCERDGLLSHFAVHVSPIFYLLLPIYYLFPDPKTLLIMQCVITFSGIIPLYLICKKYKISNLAICGFSICYLLYPSFTGASYYYLHENNFLPPLILWLIFFLESEGNNIFCFVSLFLLLFVKEDASVYAAVIGLYYSVSGIKRAWKNQNIRDLLTNPAPFTFLISIIYFMIVVTFLATKGDGAMTGRYGNYIYDNSGSLMVMLIGIIKNPIYVLTQCASAEKGLFLAYMLLPLALLPLLSRKIENWILVIPLILFNLMPAYGYQYNIRFQYAFGSGVLLIFLAVKNYSEMKPILRMKFLTVAVFSAVLVYGFHFGDSFSFYWKGYSMDQEYRATMQQAFLCIPDDASVAASTFLVPALSQRAEIYELETTNHIPEYYAVDLRGGSNAAEAFDSAPSTYESLYRYDGWIAVYRYINWEPGLISTLDAFKNLAYTLQENLDRVISEMTDDPASIESVEINDIVITRVTEDQHWVNPSDDQSTQAVYIVDKDGRLIYFSLKDADYVTTWSGPTQDERYATPDGGWCDGNGAGWTGAAHQ